MAVLAGTSPPDCLLQPALWSPRGAGPEGSAPSPLRPLRSPPRPLSPPAAAPVSAAGSPAGHSASSSSSAAAAQPPHPPAPPLQSLDLSGCLLLSERGTAALAAGLSRSLTSLQLGGCSRVSTVGDAMLDSLGRCTNLRALDLSGCTHISDTGAASPTGGSVVCVSKWLACVVEQGARAQERAYRALLQLALRFGLAHYRPPARSRACLQAWARCPPCATWPPCACGTA